MCGIAGIINFSRKKIFKEEIEKTLKSIKHRGPDDLGTWLNLNRNIALLHSRLSIQDLSKNASQPMSLNDGRYTIIFNGEIYNFKKLKSEYLSNENFKSNSDTEVVLKLFIKFGNKFLSMLNGMYAFSIYDKKTNRFFFARDEFGIKPLYYNFTNERFIFSSEIKTFFKLNVSKQFNLRSISSYLSSEYYENKNQTYFKNIMKLEPGHYLEIINNKIKISKYFNFKDYTEKVYVPKKYIERKEYLSLLISKSVSEGMISDVPLSIASSGGLDSSILQYEACKINNKTSLISWDFNEDKFSEKKYVNKISKITKAKPTFYKITPKNIIKNLKDIISINEEPFAGIPIISYYLTLKNINKNKVILDGSGIDECHGGYFKYYLKNKNYNNISQDGTLGIKKIINQDFFKKYPNYDDEILTNNSFKNKMFNDIFFMKLPRALRFRDKISMSLGFELRPVFLNKNLVSFFYKLKKEDHYKNDYSKFLLRDTYKNKISKNIAFKKKRNIQTPQSSWFKKDMNKWLELLIQNSLIWDTNLIDRKKFLIIYNLFKKGKIDNSFFIWQFINLHYFMNND